MQAMLLNAFADPGIFELHKVAKPVPGPGQVLIRNIAAGVNPIDWKTAAGGGPAALQGDFPIILGWECAGIIEAVGEQVRAFKANDQVFGFLNFPNPARCLAEYVIADIAHIAPKPDSVSFLQAGAVSLAGITAWQALAMGGHDLQGQRVLVLGGAGGVGHLAIQIAKLQGAEYVATTASTARHKVLGTLGADACYDYHDKQSMLGVDQFDLVIDGIGGDAGLAHLAWLKPDGLWVTLPSVTAEQVISAARQQGKQAQGIRATPNGNQLRALAKTMAAGKIEVLIERSFTLDELNAAMELSRSGHVQGKIVIEFSY
ncbi:MAG: NADP-dependent oxidoreductase [Gammaproteobacteria bacterium]|jgi:NADPH:quinone reductase-like Zn-dependent oxidoreductase|nr:NADP-dependent oxidoreductase [Gammaproteobacteria bacterium]